MYALKSTTMTLQTAVMLNYNYKKCTDSTILSQISTYLPVVNPALTGGLQTPVTTHIPISNTWIANDTWFFDLDTPSTLVPCCTSIAIP